MKRKVAIIVLLLMLIATFSACGDIDSEPKESAEPTPKPSDTITGSDIEIPSTDYKEGDLQAPPNQSRENTVLLMRTRVGDLIKADSESLTVNYVMVYYGLDDGSLYLSAIFEGEEHEIKIDIPGQWQSYQPSLYFRDFDNDGCVEILFLCRIDIMYNYYLSVIEVEDGVLQVTQNFDSEWSGFLTDLGFEEEYPDDDTLVMSHKDLDHDLIFKVSECCGDIGATSQNLYPLVRRIENVELTSYQDKETAHSVDAFTVKWNMSVYSGPDASVNKIYFTFIYDEASGKYVMVDAEYRNFAPYHNNK